MESWLTELEAADVGSVQADVPLAPYTTWKIGGPADVLIEPRNVEQIQRIVRFATARQIPWMVIGRGSNVLIRDGGIRGMVIHLGEAFAQVRTEDERIYVGAAYSLIKLSAYAGKEGLSGLEFAGGIPATIGGAVFMNAGAHGSDFSKIVESVSGIDANGERKIWKREELAFSYRHSALHEKPAVITDVILKLSKGDRKKISHDMAAFKNRRLQTQPLTLPCCGSVFRNPLIDPERMYAAQLIENTGLKGCRIGDAEVSPMHANFMINTGRSSAQEMLQLIEYVQKKVHEQFGVWLEPEVRIIGENPVS